MKRYDARYYITMNLLSELGYTQDEIHNILYMKIGHVTNYLNDDVTRNGSVQIHLAIAEYVLDHCKTFCGIRVRKDGDYANTYMKTRTEILHMMYHTALFRQLKPKYISELKQMEKDFINGTRKEL